ncbi:hypothetical protein FMK74_27065 [Klebsiella pneumoniae]|nr:hypothetical protein [Klebsiella variicola]MBZ6673845.1 hypothetical protein [Klebsiella pneumoniae]MBZ7249401.1 hypothetical protein [Klebsiella pneumoniae]
MDLGEAAGCCELLHEQAEALHTMVKRTSAKTMRKNLCTREQFSARP